MYYTRQRTVPCVAFFQSARQSSLQGKNAPGALCRALGKNAHGKGGAVRIPPFAVRRRRTAKSAIPVVHHLLIMLSFVSMASFSTNHMKILILYGILSFKILAKESPLSSPHS
jgi:hypothetical protein